MGRTNNRGLVFGLKPVRRPVQWVAHVYAKILLVEVSAPEDWSGSVDMDPEDYVGKREDEMPNGFHDPLAFMDKL